VSSEALALVRPVSADPVTAIARSGVFDLAGYCRIAGLPASTDLNAAIADYLQQGEEKDLAPHDLFIPSHVRRQLEELHMPLACGSVLLTYISRPDLALDPHPLFDHTRFVRANSSLTHLEDYLERRRKGEMPPSPHVLFDRAFYYDRNPDVAARGADAFVHYIRQGWKENRQPHPLFNAEFWRRAMAALRIQAPAGNPLTVYCTERSSWSASTHPLFDPEFFAEQLAAAGSTRDPRYPPLADMLLNASDCCGNRLFDSAHYRAQASVLGIQLDEHPLAHYAQGKGGGKLDPHPLFCESYYIDHNPDLARAGCGALEHFVLTGQAQGHDPNPLFSHNHYRAANPAVAPQESRLLEHYIANGGDLLDPHPLFNASAYAVRHPECLRRGDTPLAHYSRSWAAQGVRFPPWGTAFFPRRRAAADPGPPEIVLVSHELTRTGAPAILLRIVQDLVARRGLRTLVLAVKGGELLEDFCEWSDTVDLSLVRSAGIADAVFMEQLRTSFGEQYLPRLAIVNTACVDQTTLGFAGRVPVVTLVHELASGFPEESFRTIYTNSELVIFPAEFVRNEAHVLYDLPAEKTAVLSQGLLNPRFGLADAVPARTAVLEEIGAEPDAFLVLGCGTLDLRKGLDTFVLVALATLRSLEDATGRPVHFLWIGGGPSGPQSPDWFAHQDIDRSGTADRIHLLGPRTNTEPYFAACDTFIMTSRMDPFPCVIHEAMACGKPIIAFAEAGGAPEALRGGAGIVVDYGDIPAMAASLLELREDPGLASSYGERARDTVRTRFVFSDYVDAILDRVRKQIGIDFAAPRSITASNGAARGRVLIACGPSEVDSTSQFSAYLTEGLRERGFDAELVFTGELSAPQMRNCGLSVPCRVLGSHPGRVMTYKERWDALARILDVASPAVLIHNLDPVASALAPIECTGVGVLGLIQDARPEYLEQSARLGRYWQRAATTSAWLNARVLDAAPLLQDRIVTIPRILARYSRPQQRSTGEPLRIVVAGRCARRQSSVPFLLPLIRGLQAAEIDFTLTVLRGGPEAELLRIAGATDTGHGRLRIIDAPRLADIPALLSANHVTVLLSGELGTGIELSEAMCAGLAIIAVAPDVEATQRVREGVEGFLVRSARVASCIVCLQKLAADRELLENMRLAAYEAGQRAVDGPAMLDAYAALLDEMLGELRSGHYAKPPPMYRDPILGALSLPPLFQLAPDQLGFPRSP
jgi:glycosyltransferase involved in cell wall biosynthesis